MNIEITVGESRIRIEEVDEIIDTRQENRNRHDHLYSVIERTMQKCQELERKRYNDHLKDIGFEG